MVDGVRYGRGTSRDIAAAWESSFPVILGVGAGVASLLGAPCVVAAAKAHEWHLDQLYSGIFGFLAITTGFVASFYASIHTMSSGFIGRVRGTKKLRMFLVFVKRAIVSGFVVSLASIPMMVIVPLPTDRWAWQSAAVAVWVGAAVWAIVGFYRVASHLFVLFDDSERAPDEPAN